jgi:hypothetical protein
VVDWDAPEARPDGLLDGHYERFLYRMYQFSKLFPGWFEVADPQKLQQGKAISETSLVLNVASKRSNETLPKTTSLEYQLEMELIKSPKFCQHFKQVDRQFPVGLFGGKPAAATRIFTGGKSAIDIVGVGEDDSFWIFELKASDNFKVGIVSELLLYTNLIREAAHTRPRIQFDNPKQACGVGAEHVRKCTGINAVMLVENLHPILEHPDENLHPLLQHPELLNTLNTAAETCWNREPGAKPVCFSKARVWRGPDKLLATDLEVATVITA